jgi:SAM-dependent methyltransferase
LLLSSNGTIANAADVDAGTGPAPREVFRQIYQRDLWGRPSNSAFSGPGSDPRYSDPYVSYLSGWLAQSTPRRIVDLGCGDFRVGSRIAEAFHSTSVIAVDIVPELIDRNRTAFAALSNVEFQVVDMLLDELPEGEVALVRQVLQHYDNASAMLAIRRLMGRYPILFVTEHVRTFPGARPNLDKPVDQHIRSEGGLQIDKPPFSIACEIVLEVPYQTHELLRTYLVRTSHIK